MSSCSLLIGWLRPASLTGKSLSSAVFVILVDVIDGISFDENVLASEGENLWLQKLHLHGNAFYLRSSAPPPPWLR